MARFAPLIGRPSSWSPAGSSPVPWSAFVSDRMPQDARRARWPLSAPSPSASLAGPAADVRPHDRWAPSRRRLAGNRDQRGIREHRRRGLAIAAVLSRSLVIARPGSRRGRSGQDRAASASCAAALRVVMMVLLSRPRRRGTWERRRRPRSSFATGRTRSTRGRALRAGWSSAVPRDRCRARDRCQRLRRQVRAADRCQRPRLPRDG
jgi:hypothetical protein